MKDIDTAGAPMISVPAGVLKEFMSPSNSRTPTPPPTSTSTTTTSSSITTVSEVVSSPPSPSPSPTPSLTGSITTALQNITDNIAAVTTTNNSVSSEVGAKTRTPTPTSRTASPALPVPKDKTSVTITAASVHTHSNGRVDTLEDEEIKTESSNSVSMVNTFTHSQSNGKVDAMDDEVKELYSHAQSNGKVDIKDEKNLKEYTKTDSNDSNSVMNGLTGAAAASVEVFSSATGNSTSSASSSPSFLTAGVKRHNEDEENGMADLKKIRLITERSKDGGKRELKITVKEVYEALDLESKKIQEVRNSDNQSLVTLSRIKNGIAKLSGERIPGTDSPSHSHSPSATSGPESEGAATPGFPEQGLADKENVRAMRSRDRRLNKNGLKDAILRVFSENTLYGSELGHLKQMCEKLTTTLEVNMRKVAQFHKEIEDLRKVTTRLAAEHQARKGQYVAPIRIKRSVGIQAAPHIINKGIMHASVSGGNIKTISPRASNVVGVLPSSMGQNLIPGSTVGIITTSSGMRPATLTGIPASASAIPGGTSASLGTAVRAPNGQIMMMATAGTMQNLTRTTAGGVGATTAVLPVQQGRMVRAPLGNLGSVAPQTGTLISTQRPILIQNDKGASSAPTLHSALTTGKGGGVIDLTDEDEGAKGVASRTNMVPKPGTLMKVPTSGTAQFVPLQAGGVGQVVLLPNTTGGQPTALIVSQVSTGQTQDTLTNPAVAQARTTYVSHSSATRVQTATPPTPARTSVNTPSPTTVIQPSTTGMRHPAPLPKTPFQQVGGISKKLPPQPTLKLSHKDSSIVLSWTMAKTEDHETIASYQLYAYQEGAAPPSANLWKKVGSVKALELPMACTLTQFMPGHVYHFAVRAVDTKSRLGPFSEPKSIRLDKK